MGNYENYFKKDIFIVNIGIELLEISPGMQNPGWK